jgi:hypothetical protein
MPTPLWKKIAKTALPTGVQQYMINSRDVCLEVLHHHWPMKTPLGSEIMRLEWSKSHDGLRALKRFPELYTSSAWGGLETLGYEIIGHFRPKVVVELGTHVGLSALAMGLALRRLGDGAKLYAVDCWEGDDHTGAYGQEIYDTFVKRVNELELESTIVPLKMYFDDARDKVATPIDLLHIDGLHTLDAVKHDWETFGPLVRPGGLVMFHDVNTKFSDLRKFWSGLAPLYDSHLVPYSHGLGIIRTGG